MVKKKDRPPATFPVFFQIPPNNKSGERLLVPTHFEITELFQNAKVLFRTLFASKGPSFWLQTLPRFGFTLDWRIAPNLHKAYAVLALLLTSKNSFIDNDPRVETDLQDFLRSFTAEPDGYCTECDENTSQHFLGCMLTNEFATYSFICDSSSVQITFLRKIFKTSTDYTPFQVVMIMLAVESLKPYRCSYLFNKFRVFTHGHKLRLYRFRLVRVLTPSLQFFELPPKRDLNRSFCSLSLAWYYQCTFNNFTHKFCNPLVVNKFPTLLITYLSTGLSTGLSTSTDNHRSKKFF